MSEWLFLRRWVTGGQTADYLGVAPLVLLEHEHSEEVGGLESVDVVLAKHLEQWVGE